MSFFEGLRAKLERSPSRHFDQRMRQLIDQEMGRGERTESAFFAGIRLWIPAVALAGVIAFYYQSPRMVSSTGADPVPESIEFLETYETLGSLEHEDLINASDEEWAEALSGIDS